MCREVACSEQGTERSRGREARSWGVWSSFTAEGCFFECKMQNAKCKMQNIRAALGERFCKAFCVYPTPSLFRGIQHSVKVRTTFTIKQSFSKAKDFHNFAFCILHFAFCISKGGFPCIKPYTASGGRRTLTRSAVRSILRPY